MISGGSLRIVFGKLPKPFAAETLGVPFSRLVYAPSKENFA